jgi:uncharacterized RDD family membrane protein YckC
VEHRTAKIAVRGVAAVIDLLVVYVILYGIAAITGETIPGGGFKLKGAHFVAGIVASLVYFIATEAMLGATLGKIATNLCVVSESDGGPIRWRDAVVRNVLRLIDGLVLYLIGFLSICFTSKRQRLGDLAARTLVVRRSGRTIATKPV